MVEHFHFTQPFWLLALLPLALLVWWIAHRGNTRSPWRRLVDPQLLSLLLDDQKTQRSTSPLWLLAIGWLLAVLALADPAWEKQPQPLRQTSTSRVIVLDLSRSMLATDLKPSRLVRARFKVEDILAHDAEGQTGLVVFAGDAFTVSPLTRDADTIRAQLRALHPSIMPAQGSRADLGLLKAQELLQQAEVKSGQVVLIADGVQDDRAVDAAKRLHEAGYEVSVLGSGTPAGAPIPDGRGGSLRDSAGTPVLASLDEETLASIAEAGNGRYSGLHGDQSDLALLLETTTAAGDEVESDEMQAQKWKGQGPLLAVLILPIAALAFRRGWVLGMLVCTAGTLMPPQPALALDWDSLWQRRDQQAAEALQEGLYEQAAGIAEDPARRATALYRQGDYERAAQDFSRAAGADGAYNHGNALARLGRYRESISAYERALEMQPDMQDALTNKAAVEALLNQQQQSSQQSPEQQENQDQSSQQEQQTSSTQDEKDQQDRQQEQASSGQDDSDRQDPQQSSDSSDSGDQGSGPQADAQEDAGNPGKDDPSDSADSGQQDDPSPSADGQTPQANTKESPDARQAGQDDQLESADGGNPERDSGSEDTTTQEAETGTQKQPESGPESAENQFAEANRRLDQGRERAESEQSEGSRDEQKAAERPQADRPPQPERPQTGTAAQALNSEEQMAAQQWLRRIPDDPGGLLRRKFLYQYRQRARRADGGSHQDW